MKQKRLVVLKLHEILTFSFHDIIWVPRSESDLMIHAEIKRINVIQRKVVITIHDHHNRFGFRDKLDDVTRRFQLNNHENDLTIDCKILN